MLAVSLFGIAVYLEEPVRGPTYGMRIQTCTCFVFVPLFCTRTRTRERATGCPIGTSRIADTDSSLSRLNSNYHTPSLRQYAYYFILCTQL